jgi:hypothetical protein
VPAKLDRQNKILIAAVEARILSVHRRDFGAILNRMMASIMISTLVYVIVAYFVRRYLVELGIPAGLTRGTAIFIAAGAASYAVVSVVDLVAS